MIEKKVRTFILQPVPGCARYRWILLFILIVGLMLRLWLWADQGQAGMVYPGDQDEYYRGAIHMLLQGDYYDDGQWLRPPMTSIFLAGVFALVGVNVPLALLVQCALSLGTVLLLAELARSLFDSYRAGLVAAFLSAVFLPYASYASQLLSETLFIFTVTAALLIFEAARRRGMPWLWLLAGGLMWGVSTLTRPVGLFALPLLLLWVIIQRPHTGWRVTGCVLAGFMLVVAPWSARNYVVHRHVILVDTNGGMSFWLGNLLEPGERELQFVWNRTIPNLAERQQVAVQRALENIARQPWMFLARTRNKAVSLWQFDTRLFVANAPIGITLDERSLPFALASDAEYGILMLLALVGVVLARPGEYNLPLLIWPLYGTLLSAVSLGHPRLRLPLLITAFVYAALPLAHPCLVWSRLRTASWRRWLGLLAGIGGLALLWYARVYGSFIQSQGWLLVARLQGNTAPIEQAIAAMPDNYLPYMTLGDMRRAEGDLSGALEAYEQAAVRAPQNTYVHMQRLDLYRQMGEETGMGEAMAAIEEVGWDNNQLYDWAWTHLPASSDALLAMREPAAGVLRGVYASQWDGERIFRWTMGQVQMRFDAPQARALLLTLRGDYPDTPVQVFYQGHPVAVLRVGSAWEEFRVALPTNDERRATSDGRRTTGDQRRATSDGRPATGDERPTTSDGRPATSDGQTAIGDGGGIMSIMVHRRVTSSQVVELRVPPHVVSVEEPYARGVAVERVEVVHNEGSDQ